MNGLFNLWQVFNSFLKKRRTNDREMKRVFQWRRYIEWNDLTLEEKLAAKRFLLLPLLAYLIVDIFNHNFLLIVLFLFGYVLYKKFEKGEIFKK